MKTSSYLRNRLAGVARTFLGKEKSATRRPALRLNVETLEDRLVPALTTIRATAVILSAPTVSTHTAVSQIQYLFTTPGSAAWFQNSFQDAGIRNLAQTEFTRDGTITRNDMIALFNQAEADGVVTSAELHDLRFVVANASMLKMPDYVSYLANKVVNSDLGNSTYQPLGLSVSVGGGPVSNYEVTWPLGNLYAGYTGGMLSELVDKWFMGDDLPTTDIINSDGSVTPATGYGYDSVGTLFGPGPRTVSCYDITQGDTGDCWFLSAAADIANQSPNTILNNIFINNGDGTYTLRLFDQNDNPAFVTVNRWLPQDANGNFVFANSGQSLSDPTAKLWVPLLEKAVAQLNESGGLGRDGTNSYQGLSGGHGFCGMTYMTGLPNGMINEGMASESYFNATVTSGNLVTMLTYGNAGDPLQNIDQWTIVPNHVYAVLKYDASTGIYQLYNPWGQASGDASFQIGVNWSEINDIFESWDWGANPANIPMATTIANLNAIDPVYLAGGSAMHATATMQPTTPQVIDWQPTITTHQDATHLLIDVPTDPIHGNHQSDLDLLAATRLQTLPTWAVDQIWTEAGEHKGRKHDGQFYFE